jgi:hypothetical protein
MIHHVSIGAARPEHVARVLAEIIGGFARPFPGAIPGAWQVLAGDVAATAIEVYAERTALRPGDAERAFALADREPPAHASFHVYMSVSTPAATILAVAAREGWRAGRFWRGPPHAPVFELIELWVENRILVELATPEMLPAYVATSDATAVDALRSSGVPGPKR